MKSPRNNPAPHYTPIERRMMAVLADGKAHTSKELHGCLVDDLGPTSNIWAHLTHLRKKLRPFSKDIVCWLVRQHSYYVLTSADTAESA